MRLGRLDEARKQDGSGVASAKKWVPRAAKTMPRKPKATLKMARPLTTQDGTKKKRRRLLTTP